MEKGVSKLAYCIKEIFIDQKVNEFDWLQFFTLRYNSKLILSTFSKIENDLYTKKKSLMKVYLVKSIDVFCTECGIRIFNAAQAICDTIEHVSPRISQKTDAFGFLLGNDTNAVVKKLAERCDELLSLSNNCTLRTLSLHLLICLLSVSSSPSLIRSLIQSTSIYPSILSILNDSELCSSDGPASLLLLTLLAGDKYSADTDFFAEKLIAEFRDSSLTGYESIIYEWIVDCVNVYKDKLACGSPSLFGSLVNTMSSFLTMGEEKSIIEFGSSDDELENLLALYYAVRSNQKFTSLLTVMKQTRPNVNSELDTVKETNFLSVFLTYCSFIIHDSKHEYSKRRCEICLLILMSIVDDMHALSVMHNPNLLLSTPLYRPPMLHRDAEFVDKPQACTIAAAFYDLIYEFIMSHMLITFPHHLYQLAIGIIHRMVAFEKRTSCRITKWKPIFEALLALLNFLASNEMHVDVTAVHQICVQIMILLNLFITYGDTFLPNDIAYDHMCYEIIRQEAVFRKLLKSAAKLRETDSENEENSRTATKIISQLENPLEIVSHFKDKLAQLNTTSFSEEEVLEVVRKNFDSLHLKLYEGLETAEPYDPNCINALLDDLRLFVKRNSKKRYSLQNFQYSDMLNALSSIESRKSSAVSRTHSRKSSASIDS